MAEWHFKLNETSRVLQFLVAGFALAFSGNDG